MNEIMLCKNAPSEYINREVLWNAVQNEETRYDAQYARDIEMALPVEMSRKEQISCVRDYLKENFVEKGMIADWALHDKGDGNPHVHVMLTLREIDKNQKWKKKSRSVYANDINPDGKAFYNPELPSYDPKNKKETSQYRIPDLDKNGNQKTRVRKGKGIEYLWKKVTISENDWNSKSNVEIWRKSWAIHCNRYLQFEKQIDHRSYERQGINQEATAHEGYVARKIASAGRISDRCEINEGVKFRNLAKKQIDDITKEIIDFIKYKAGELIGRYERFRKCIKDSSKRRSNDGFIGGTTIRDRSINCSEGTDGKDFERTRKLNQYITETECAITETERAIARTEQTIKRLIDFVRKKEEESYARFRKIQKRRANADYAGRTTGPDRTATIYESFSQSGKERAIPGHYESKDEKIGFKTGIETKIRL